METGPLLATGADAESEGLSDVELLQPATVANVKATVSIKRKFECLLIMGSSDLTERSILSIVLGLLEAPKVFVAWDSLAAYTAGDEFPIDHRDS